METLMSIKLNSVLILLQQEKAMEAPTERRCVPKVTSLSSHRTLDRGGSLQRYACLHPWDP
jgi:hypothetical protein